MADLFSSLPPSLQAQFLHTVCQETCCVCHMANSGQRGDHSPCVASLLFLLHFLFLLLLLAWAYTPKYNSVRKTSLSSLSLYSLITATLAGLPRRLSGKELACQFRKYRRHGFDPWVRKIPWSKKRNALQYSCLGNPMDRGAWWAAVHGVTESQTRLSTPRTTLVFLATKRVGLPHTLRVPSVPGGHLLVVTQFTSALTQSTSGYRWIPQGKGPVS